MGQKMQMAAEALEDKAQVIPMNADDSDISLSTGGEETDGEALSSTDEQPPSKIRAIESTTQPSIPLGYRPSSENGLACVAVERLLTTWNEQQKADGTTPSDLRYDHYSSKGFQLAFAGADGTVLWP